MRDVALQPGGCSLSSWDSPETDTHPGRVPGTPACTGEHATCDMSSQRVEKGRLPGVGTG